MCSGKHLNTRTRRKYALREGMRLVAHCGFTMHEPGLHSSGTNAACVTLSFSSYAPVYYVLTSNSWRRWLSETGEEGRRMQGESCCRMIDNFLDEQSSRFSRVSLVSKCRDSALFLPNTEEVRVDIKQN